ncbi:MAG: hypothetical protein ACRDJW_22015 [Thermomicrobiales bacterium]
MFRAVALAITLLWLFTSAAAACEPPPVDNASGSTGGVRARTTDATPTTPGPTDPAACTVAPRTLPELRQLIVDAGQAGATPSSEPSPVSLSALPTGEPADIETIAAITATVEQFMACINAGDALRFVAFVSDDFLRTVAADLGFVLDDTTELQTPAPLDEDEWTRLGEVTAARVLPDGRVGAVIIPAPPDDEPVFFIFVEEGDRWLIDGFVEIEDEDVDCCADSTTTTWQPVQGDAYEGVIVPEGDGPRFFRSLAGAEPAGYWTPAASAIAQLEEDLFVFIVPPPCGESPAPDQIWQELDSYRRQYAGFVADDGRRLILVNAFCTDTGLDWRSQPVAVADGGACFFQLTYDPTTGDFSDLDVNGEA